METFEMVLALPYSFFYETLHKKIITNTFKITLININKIKLTKASKHPQMGGAKVTSQLEDLHRNISIKKRVIQE